MKGGKVLRLLVSKIGIASGIVMLVFGSIIFVIAPTPENHSRLSGLILVAIGVSTLLNHLSKYLSLTSTRESSNRRFVYVSDCGPSIKPTFVDDKDTRATEPLFFCDEPDTTSVSGSERFPFLVDDKKKPTTPRRHSFLESIHKDDALIDVS